MHLCYCVNQADDSDLYLNTVLLPILNFLGFLVKEETVSNLTFIVLLLGKIK